MEILWGDAAGAAQWLSGLILCWLVAVERLEQVFVYSLNRAHSELIVTFLKLCFHCTPPSSEPGDMCDEVIHILCPCSQMSVSLSDCLGSKVFSVIKSDINGNITASIEMSVPASAPVCFHAKGRNLNVIWDLNGAAGNSTLICISFRKLKQCILRTLRSTLPCRTSWRPSGTRMKERGLKLEQH